MQEEARGQLWLGREAARADRVEREGTLPDGGQGSLRFPRDGVKLIWQPGNLAIWQPGNLTKCYQINDKNVSNYEIHGSREIVLRNNQKQNLKAQVKVQNRFSTILIKFAEKNYN